MANEPIQTASAKCRTNADSVPLVSILVVNFNGAKWLPACLDSLASVSYPNREVIVVDNASTDNSLAVLSAYPSVKTIRSGRNLGFAGGNNLALQHASGDYILLLNNDTVVPPDFLQPLVQHLQSHSEAGAVQGKMILPRFDNRLDVCGSFITALGLPYHYGYYKLDGPAYQRSFSVFSGKGACLMFRRDLVPAVGGFLFDEEFFCYYEESDFCHRVWLAGFEVHFVPGPPVAHFMGATAGGSQSAFVLSHYLPNMAFSLQGNLSLRYRLRILPLLFAMLLLSLAAAALRLNGGAMAAHWKALVTPFSRFSKIHWRRRLVRGLRRQSDQAIFQKVMRTPRMAYFVKTLRGKLAEYQDEALGPDARS